MLESRIGSITYIQNVLQDKVISLIILTVLSSSPLFLGTKSLQPCISAELSLPSNQTQQSRYYKCQYAWPAKLVLVPL